MIFLTACYGMIGAQMALFAIWCALVPLHWLKRMLMAVISGLVLYGAWAAGYAIYTLHSSWLRERLWERLVTGLLCLPILLLAVQIPLWMMRIWFRWRIAHPDEDSSETFQPLRIRDLMIATTAIAMALAAAQLSQTISVPSGNGSIVPLVVAAIVIMVLSAISVLPAVLAVLRSRRLLLAMGFVFSVYVAIAGSYAALIVLLSEAPLDWEMFVGMPALAVGFFVELTLPLLIARRFGYRLLWGRPPKRDSQVRPTE